MIRWRQEPEKAKAEGKPEPARIYSPQGRASPHHPANLYNGMLAPLVPFGIAGAIWYPKESNAGQAYQYRKLFPAMIQSWRDVWGQGDFPFLFVQLANYMATKPEPSDSAWAEAKIEGATVVVRSPQVAKPVAVRYAWADNPVCNLYNREGLPASPFRTDDWSGVMINSK